MLFSEEEPVLEKVFTSFVHLGAVGKQLIPSIIFNFWHDSKMSDKSLINLYSAELKILVTVVKLAQLQNVAARVFKLVAFTKKPLGTFVKEVHPSNIYDVMVAYSPNCNALFVIKLNFEQLRKK
jgi:hypothetical protein